MNSLQLSNPFIINLTAMNDILIIIDNQALKSRMLNLEVLIHKHNANPLCDPFQANFNEKD